VYVCVYVCVSVQSEVLIYTVHDSLCRQFILNGGAKSWVRSKVNSNSCERTAVTPHAATHTVH